MAPFEDKWWYVSGVTVCYSIPHLYLSQTIPVPLYFLELIDQSHLHLRPRRPHPLCQQHRKSLRQLVLFSRFSLNVWIKLLHMVFMLYTLSISFICFLCFFHFMDSVERFPRINLKVGAVLSAAAWRIIRNDSRSGPVQQICFAFASPPLRVWNLLRRS